MGTSSHTASMLHRPKPLVLRFPILLKFIQGSLPLFIFPGLAVGDREEIPRLSIAGIAFDRSLISIGGFVPLSLARQYSAPRDPPIDKAGRQFGAFPDVPGSFREFVAILNQILA